MIICVAHRPLVEPVPTENQTPVTSALLGMNLYHCLLTEGLLTDGLLTEGLFKKGPCQKGIRRRILRVRTWICPCLISCNTICKFKGLANNNGEGVGVASEVLLPRKGGGGVSATLKGGTNCFGGRFHAVA